MLTTQQIFDKVALHLMTQLRTSRGPNPQFAPPASEAIVCYYRAENGDKCAAGCLISDEDYNPVIEGKDAKQQVVSDVLYKNGVDMTDREVSHLVVTLQICHDRVPPRLEDFDLSIHHSNREGECWKTELVRIANEFRLDIPDCLK